LLRTGVAFLAGYSDVDQDPGRGPLRPGPIASRADHRPSVGTGGIAAPVHDLGGVGPTARDPGSSPPRLLIRNRWGLLAVTAERPDLSWPSLDPERRRSRPLCCQGVWRILPAACLG